MGAKLAAENPCNPRSTPSVGRLGAMAQQVVVRIRSIMPQSRIFLRPYRSEIGPQMRKPLA